MCHWLVFRHNTQHSEKMQATIKWSDSSYSVKKCIICLCCFRIIIWTVLFPGSMPLSAYYYLFSCFVTQLCCWCHWNFYWFVVGPTLFCGQSTSELYKVCIFLQFSDVGYCIVQNTLNFAHKWKQHVSLLVEKLIRLQEGLCHPSGLASGSLYHIILTEMKQAQSRRNQEGMWRCSCLCLPDEEQTGWICEVRLWMVIQTRAISIYQKH